jgi:uncharacterized protein (DUF362 family)/Pyruvate/2-oxoacid:ferredoxin oxidoreductase delta subunit
MSKVKFYKSDYTDISFLIPQIFSDFSFNFKNKKVFIKPNLLSAHPPEKGITTHPLIIKELTQYLLDKGAFVKVGDNPSLQSKEAIKKVGEITKIEEAALGTYTDISKDYKKIKTDIGELFVSSAILDCDILISVPKLKTHMLTLFTIAIKNMFGIIIGNQKSRLHYQFPTPWEFAEALLTIYEIRKPDLTIVDGIIAMEGNGPSNGNLRKLNTIGVSDNGYLLEWAIIGNLLNKNPLSVPYLNIAKKKNLFNLDKLTIEGDYNKVKDFKLPSQKINNLLNILGKGIIKLVYHPLRYKKINIDKNLCKLCGECVRICPNNALKLEGKEIKYNKSLCISCFCCYEVCPYLAIKI